MSTSHQVLGPRVFTMQIIAGALAAGCVVLLAVAVYVVQTNDGKGIGGQPEEAPPVLSLMAIALLVMETPVAVFLPRLIQRKGLEALANSPRDGHVAPALQGRAGEQLPAGTVSDTDFLLGNYQTAMILALALFEGASFLGSIAYMMEGRPLALGVSLAAVALLLTRFPTEGRVTAWLEQARREVEALRARNRARPPG